MITLKEAKNYLRVDYEEDDSLIQNLLSTAKNLVMDVGRLDDENFTKNEDIVRTAMLFALGYLYENRSNPDYKKLTLNLRSILFAQREGVMYWKLETRIRESQYLNIERLLMRSATILQNGKKHSPYGQR